MTPLNEPVLSHDSYLKTVAADIYGYSKGRKPHILKWLERITAIARLRFLMFEKKESAGEITNSGAPPGPNPPGPGAPPIQTTPPATGKVFIVTSMSPDTSAVKRPVPPISSPDNHIMKEKRVTLTLEPISIMPVPL